MKDSAQKDVLMVVGSLHKGTIKPPTSRSSKPELFTALDCYPLHAFSEEGRRNLCARFKLTDEELESVLLAYERPDEPTEEERRAADMLALLRIIDVAVAPKRKPAIKEALGGGGKK